MTERKATALWDSQIVKRALVDSLRKFDPRIQAHNPVMFVVEVTALAVTIILCRDFFLGRGTLAAFEFQIALWLWFTVLFANFAEAMAEGRGKAQADNLRKTRTETQAKLVTAGRRDRMVAATELKRGDVVLVEAGDMIPGDGEVDRGHRGGQRGRDHRRIRAGHSRKRRRSQRRHRRHHGHLRPHQGAHHRQSGRDLPRPHDRAGRRRAAAEDAQRNRAQHPARRPDDHFHAGVREPLSVRALWRHDRSRCRCWWRCWYA